MGSRRRVSVDFYTGQAVSSMQQTVETLHQLWDDVSMEDHQRLDRVDGFYKILKQLMDDVIDSEKKMVESVHSSISQWLQDIQDMRKELNMPVFDCSGFQHGSIALFKALEKERTRLLSLKEDRINGQAHMIEELLAVASRIGDEVVDLKDSDKQELWTDDRMEFWQQKLESFCRILNERLDEARQWKADIRRWTGQTNSAPSSELESVFFDIDLEDPERVFDKTFMDEFREAHSIAKKNYNEWLEQAEFDYTESIVKLKEMWELCHVPEGDRHFAAKFNPNVHTAVDIQNIKAEVAKLTRFHEQRAPVYDKLKQWKELWAEKISFECHANEKAYYQNRGGQLQALLQRQKQVENRLPVVFKELKKENDIYKKEYPDAPIILDGLDPPEYVEWIIREYKEQREIERNRKKKAAACGTPDINKMTPKKRVATPAFVTPATGAKVPRVQSCTRIRTPLKKTFTTSGTPKMRNREMSIYGSTTSLQSAIVPTRPLTYGPKTSSPIDDGIEKNMPPPSSTKRRYEHRPLIPKNFNSDSRRF
uniref:Protein regulator of cytokinesis 1 n=1 Tax=Syphacia muris TaxID=451379 RepID=A0A0N5AWI5_9BILA